MAAAPLKKTCQGQTL